MTIWMFEDVFLTHRKKLMSPSQKEEPAVCFQGVGMNTEIWSG